VPHCPTIKPLDQAAFVDAGARRTLHARCGTRRRALAARIKGWLSRAPSRGPRCPRAWRAGPSPAVRVSRG